jgi:uncharacterized protein YdeI (YjbR/CyaY-like superfamily)
MGNLAVFFSGASEFRSWLEINHRTETELMVGYYKVGTGKPSMTWSDSVDEALCFGWIDGVRRSIDEMSYCIRFTPRKPKSNWSEVNLKKVDELIRLGKMMPAGIEIYEKRTQNKSSIYSYENRPEHFTPVLEAVFRQNQAAWDYFCKQAPSYQKTNRFWVMSAKQEATRLLRLQKLIESCAGSNRLF